MSDGDFAEQLRQSVQDQLALIQSAARAAKARIGQGVANATATSAPAPRPSPAPDAPQVPEYTGIPPTRSSATVDFFADEPRHDGLEPEDPAFAAAVEGGGEGLPEGSIEFDNYAQEGVDDDGIPVWEEPP